MTEDQAAYTTDLKTLMAQGLDDMKDFIILQSGGHIRLQLYQLPEQIRERALTVSDLTAGIEKLRQSIAYSKNKALELVSCATVTENGKTKDKFSNETARKAAVEVILREDESYLLSTDDIGRKESELRREQIQLDFLHNTFRAYLAVAGMNGVR